MFDDEGELFNPFSIGPPEAGQRYEYEIPNSPTYPPPVFATWPPPKEHANKSVSQGTLAKERSTTGQVVFKTTKSEMGQLAISKAINEEMAAAKQQVASEARIYAGGMSRTAMQRTPSKSSLISGSVKTIMPIRTRRSASKSSVMSQASKASVNSVHSRLSGQAAADRMSSKMSVHSHASKRTESNVTLKSHTEVKHSKKSINMAKTSEMNAKEQDNISRTTQRSKTLEHQSRASFRDKAGENEADKVSRVSVRSQATNTSRVSIRSLTRENQADNISQVSVRSNVSRRSLAGDNVSSSNFIGNKADAIAHKSKLNTLKSMNSIGNINLPLRERADLVKKELSQSMQTTKSLAFKAFELSERLKAGNEFKYNRFHALGREYTIAEPMKRCRDDRMSFWFKDAVLS